MKEEKIGKDIRAVIILGRSLAITLPKEFVQMHDIKPKDKIELLFNSKIIGRPLKKKDLEEELAKLDGDAEK
jgi:antitoxin component of MazEF toxin-antitoxin module